MEQWVHLEHCVTLHYVIYGTGQCMGEDGSRFARAMFCLQAGQIFLADRIMPEQEPRRFRKRPRERGIADLRAGGALAFPRRFLGACDEPARGHKGLDPGKATHSMDVVEQHHTQNLADTGDGWQPIEGRGVVLLGRLHDGQLHVAAPLVLGANQGEIACDALRHGGSREALGDPVAVGFGGDLLPDLGQVVRSVGIVDMA